MATPLCNQIVITIFLIMSSILDISSWDLLLCRYIGYHLLAFFFNLYELIFYGVFKTCLKYHQGR